MRAEREEEVDAGSESESEIEEEEEEEEEGVRELEKQLEEVPLGELLKARADGSHGTYRKNVDGKTFSRANKNRPAEMSSKAPVGRFREVIQVPKKIARDPRFENLCGTLDQDGFRKRYNFLFQVELPEEKKKLQRMVKMAKDPKVIAELHDHISWIDKQMKSGIGSSKRVDAQILAEHKKNEREAVKQGKMPFYLKKSEIRERRLVQKYNELKASGKLDAFIDKRRKKNASKDHRYMPYRRPSGAE